tara:strand:- start:1358 stop:1774 length:417 start_codon:yes stop_codon:yes gene_type:complete
MNNSVRRLVNSNYDRPKTTYQDTIQNKEAMMEKLKNYVRAEDVDDVPIDTHVRYVTLDKNKKQVFRLGGLVKKIHPKYVILSNGSFGWSVQRYHYVEGVEDPVFETVFWRVISKESRMEQKIEEQRKEIIRLKKLLNK